MPKGQKGMYIKKEQIPLLIINSLGIIVFAFVFLNRQNYEFIIYLAVIVFFLLLILFTNRKINYPMSLLWGLTLWAFMHMAGGGIYISGHKIYEIMILKLIGEPYNIFRYDQLVHIIGFGVSTLLMYHLLRPLLKPDLKRWTALSIVVVMAGLGVGALNEIIEFIATVIVPETGVGGYINTSLDLVSDMIGAIIAIIYIQITDKN